jgi:hypothetical protein
MSELYTSKSGQRLCHANALLAASSYLRAALLAPLNTHAETF